MTARRALNASVTPELHAFIAERLASGRYGNVSEAVRAALRLLEKRELGFDGHRMARADGPGPDGPDLTSVGIFVGGYEATERIRAEAALEQALHDSKDFTRLALSAVGGVGVWTFDVASDCFTCDAVVSALYGVDPERGAAGIGGARSWPMSIRTTCPA